MDLISRQAAIEAIKRAIWDKYIAKDGIDAICNVPSAQPEYRLDEWCTNCKEYDQEKHCCPRFNRVIQTTLQEMQSERKKGKWYEDEEVGLCRCDQCQGVNLIHTPFCPNCGAEMQKGEENGEKTSDI